jgi:o-succinylbenzoate synthase
MHVRELRWARYRVPLRSPIITGRGALRFRDGAIVELVTDDGFIGLGEIAPLPPIDQSLEDALALLSQVAVSHLGAAAPAHRQGQRALPGDSAQGSAGGHGSGRPQLVSGGLVRVWEELQALPPAVRLGLETALLDALGRASEESVAGLLCSPRGGARQAVAVNAVIGVAGPAAAADAARAAVAAGFGCVKLKVGMCGDPAAEVARIAMVRVAIGPDVRLRLDANAAWSQAQAVEVLARASAFAIQYVEQPLAPDDLQGMRRLRMQVSMPIAADEAVTDLARARQVLEAEAADVLVLKPQCVGGLAACMAIRRLAGEHGVDCVVTSAMEAGVGVAAALHLAAADPASTLECGLATLELLEDDLITQPLVIERGKMLVPEGPGLGVALDRQALARYTVA